VRPRVHDQGWFAAAGTPLLDRRDLAVAHDGVGLARSESLLELSTGRQLGGSTGRAAVRARRISRGQEVEAGDPRPRALAIPGDGDAKTGGADGTVSDDRAGEEGRLGRFGPGRLPGRLEAEQLEELARIDVLALAAGEEMIVDGEGSDSERGEGAAFEPRLGHQPCEPTGCRGFAAPPAEPRTQGRPDVLVRKTAIDMRTTPVRVVAALPHSREDDGGLVWRGDPDGRPQEAAQPSTGLDLLGIRPLAQLVEKMRDLRAHRRRLHEHQLGVVKTGAAHDAQCHKGGIHVAQGLCRVEETGPLGIEALPIGAGNDLDPLDGPQRTVESPFALERQFLGAAGGPDELPELGCQIHGYAPPGDRGGHRERRCPADGVGQIHEPGGAFLGGVDEAGLQRDLVPALQAHGWRERLLLLDLAHEGAAAGLERGDRQHPDGLAVELDTDREESACRALPQVAAWRPPWRRLLRSSDMHPLDHELDILVGCVARLGRRDGAEEQLGRADRSGRGPRAPVAADGHGEEQRYDEPDRHLLGEARGWTHGRRSVAGERSPVREAPPACYERMRMMCASRSLGPLVALALLLSPHGGEAATAPRERLDAYALFATEGLRVEKTTIRRGDLGVNDGVLSVGRGVRAADALLAAPRLRLARDAACAGTFGDRRGAAIGCPRAGGAMAPLVAEVGPGCGMLVPFPACDRTRRVEVAKGTTRRLGGGVYGRVIVRGGTLELAGGHYVFCAIEIARGGSLRAAAPVEIDVAGSVVLHDRARLEPAPDVVLSADDIRVRVGEGRVAAGRRARLVASVCAPERAVRLVRTTLEGRIVARQLRARGGEATAPLADERRACAVRDPLRRPYFGDLHVHTKLSFDVFIFGASPSLEDAYRFARGEPLLVAPNDVAGQPTQTVRLDRPLDFAAVTDHSEFLGEVETCTVPGRPGYDSETCVNYRKRGSTAFVAFGGLMYLGSRDPATCGSQNERCLELASGAWRRIQDAAEAAYDRSPRCGFTTFVGYEHTAVAISVSTLHRNVFFRGNRVPVLPTSYFEARNRAELWRLLRDQCVGAGTGCDVLAIPHNSNESNGRAFLVEYPGATSPDEERAQAALGGSMEPLVEIFQHKGDSECMNGLSGIVGAADELCDFEKRYRAPEDCGDGVGSWGAQDSGCLSRRDFARGALLEGLREQERLGVNPFRLGFIASTDTHSGTAGYVAEDAYLGHQGESESTTEARLGDGTDLAGLGHNPGGLAGVWAEENSRGAIFDALRRRETFGTSGPRITVRLFAGYGFPSSLCADPDMIRKAYAGGVAMGGVLGAPPPAGPAAPTIVVTALRDPGTAARPGTPLERLQIVKGWLAGGEAHVAVYDVAGGPNPAATVDASCRPVGSGADQLCAVWTDPDFDPRQHAWYYARVVENPTCRWSTWECLRLPAGSRPPVCGEPQGPVRLETVQERAWTSPVWYEPADS